MKPEEKRFEEYIKSMTPEQKQECLELIRKNNQGILAKDFILSEMPACLDTDDTKEHFVPKFMQSILKKAVVL